MVTAGLRGNPQFAVGSLPVNDNLAAALKRECQNATGQLAVNAHVDTIELLLNVLQEGVNPLVKFTFRHRVWRRHCYNFHCGMEPKSAANGVLPSKKYSSSEAMRFPRILRILLLTVLTSTLIACGQKGPLKLPEVPKSEKSVGPSR